MPEKKLYGSGRVEITGLAHDSRLVRPGDLFIAVRGQRADGHRFIPQALEKGSVAVVVEEAGHSLPVPCVVVPDSRLALAHLAASFHGHPARRMRVIGVTGTDGKTTTVNLIHSILAAAGYKSSLVSSVNAIIGEKYYDTGLHTTTPDALEIQHYLAEMVAAGTEYAVLESTSHGLAQGRVAACEYDVAVVTNITHEHLDYHGTYESYREAKATLFRYLYASFRKPQTPKVAILNADDSSFDYLRPIPADFHISYGLEGQADVWAEDITYSPALTAFTAHTPQGDFRVRTSLAGCFNVYNILAAIAVALSQNISFEAMQRGIESLKGVIGRMERIDLGQDFTVIVDFAHTPNSLRQALKTLREMAEREIIVVFGCAGLRDVGKRPMMGEIAARLADRVVITAEDPRTESLEEIMAQIAQGCRRAGAKEGENFWRIGDRKEAIEFALNLARPGDLVIVTGKGHEKSMCFGEVEYPWSEHEAVKEVLEKLLVIYKYK